MDNCAEKTLMMLINGLSKQLQVFNTVLNGYSVLIPKTKHCLNFIKGYHILNPSGNEVIVSVKIYPDQSFQVDSNVLLDNHSLFLY